MRLHCVSVVVVVVAVLTVCAGASCSVCYQGIFDFTATRVPNVLSSRLATATVSSVTYPTIRVALESCVGGCNATSCFTAPVRGASQLTVSVLSGFDGGSVSGTSCDLCNGPAVSLPIASDLGGAWTCDSPNLCDAANWCHYSPAAIHLQQIASFPTSYDAHISASSGVAWVFNSTFIALASSVLDGTFLNVIGLNNGAVALFKQRAPQCITNPFGVVTLPPPTGVVSAAIVLDAVYDAANSTALGWSSPSLDTLGSWLNCSLAGATITVQVDASSAALGGLRDFCRTEVSFVVNTPPTFTSFTNVETVTVGVNASSLGVPLTLTSVGFANFSALCTNFLLDVRITPFELTCYDVGRTVLVDVTAFDQFSNTASQVTPFQVVAGGVPSAVPPAAAIVSPVLEPGASTFIICRSRRPSFSLTGSSDLNFTGVWSAPGANVTSRSSSVGSLFEAVFPLGLTTVSYRYFGSGCVGGLEAKIVINSLENLPAPNPIGAVDSVLVPPSNLFQSSLVYFLGCGRNSTRLFSPPAPPDMSFSWGVWQPQKRARLRISFEDPNDPNTEVTIGLGSVAAIEACYNVSSSSSCNGGFGNGRNCTVLTLVAAFEVSTAEVSTEAMTLCTKGATAETEVSASPPTFGIGSWSVVSEPYPGLGRPGAQIADPFAATTNVTGLLPGATVLAWTVGGEGCTPSVETITIETFSQVTADAGPDLDIGCATSVDIEPVSVPPGTSGSWRIVSGSASLSNEGNAAFLSLINGTVVVEWTLFVPGCSVNPTSQRTIKQYSQVSPAVATPVLSFGCAGSGYLSAVPPLNGFGSWSLVDPNNTALIIDPSDPFSAITGVSSNMTLFWTVSAPSCQASQQVVSVVKTPQASLACAQCQIISLGSSNFITSCDPPVPILINANGGTITFTTSINANSLDVLGSSSLVVANGATLIITGALQLFDGSSLTLSIGAQINAVGLFVGDSASLVLAQGSTIVAQNITVQGGTLNLTEGQLNVTESVSLSPQSVVYFDNNGPISLNVNGRLTLGGVFILRLVKSIFSQQQTRQDEQFQEVVMARDDTVTFPPTTTSSSAATTSASSSTVVQQSSVVVASSGSLSGQLAGVSSSVAYSSCNEKVTQSSAVSTSTSVSVLVSVSRDTSQPGCAVQSSSGGLSAGAIAGIVVGSLVAFAALFTVLILLWRKREIAKQEARFREKDLTRMAQSQTYTTPVDM